MKRFESDRRTNRARFLSGRSRKTFHGTWLTALVLVLFPYSPGWTQDEFGETLGQAEKWYNSGRFDQVVSCLNHCLAGGDLSPKQRLEAYRLLAMTYIATDYFDKAETTIEKLLSIQPNFDPSLRDPPLFAEMVREAKEQRVTVVSASKQAEPIQEAPVPVTVISREMISSIGARTLKDVLETYVPGMTFVQDHNEVVVAARGIYGSSQQKMLIMLDGHRLNQRAYSAANPDYSISLDKVEQIEVLRGPGSSLYGNVALTAVINIVTREGAGLQGMSVRAGSGNYGQRNIGFLYGRHFERGNELLLWGNAYSAEGEKARIPLERNYSKQPEEEAWAILDGFKDRPAYDFGLKYRFEDVTLLGNIRYCKYIEPFSAGGVTGETYTYERYHKYLGMGPGLGTQSTHLNLSYERVLSDESSLQARGYYDTGSLEVMLVIDPANERYGSPGWREWDLGTVVHLSRTHRWGRLGSGNIIGGIQVDRMRVYDSHFLLGEGGEWTSFGADRDNPLLPRGEETIYSAFSQFKHYLREDLILNLGLRYDQKDRHKGANISNFSPRLALIFSSGTRFNLKVSYAQSFVDAPYWYRYNSLPSYRGGEHLRPEYLSSLQVSPSVKWAGGKGTSSVNFFYNVLTDFVWRNNEASEDEPIYQNAGGLRSWGLEDETAFVARKWKLRANFTYQRVIDARRYSVTGHRIDNVPSWVVNTIADFRPLSAGGRDLWCNITTRYLGKQTSPYQTPYVRATPEESVDAIFIVHGGFWIDRLLNDLSLKGRVFNLFDMEYTQGGSVPFPYPQPGRWYLAQLSYAF